MPFDTKERIAQTVLEMIRQQPVSKITVQRIMEKTNMKRQSFYYHFKDIYDVLDWSVTRYFCERGVIHFYPLLILLLHFP